MVELVFFNILVLDVVLGLFWVGSEKSGNAVIVPIWFRVGSEFRIWFFLKWWYMDQNFRSGKWIKGKRNFEIESASNIPIHLNGTALFSEVKLIFFLAVNNLSTSCASYWPRMCYFETFAINLELNTKHFDFTPLSWYQGYL